MDVCIGAMSPSDGIAIVETITIGRLNVKYMQSRTLADMYINQSRKSNAHCQGHAGEILRSCWNSITLINMGALIGTYVPRCVHTTLCSYKKTPSCMQNS